MLPATPVPDTQKAVHSNPIEARLQLAAIVDSSDDAIIGKDLEGIITSWNAAATRLFGYQPEEIIGKSVLTLIPPELQFEEPEILRKVTSGKRIEHFETCRLSKDGRRLDISLTISPIRDNTGRIVGISKIARDITERKLTEAALFESERMASIGRMAASIAHEVNNPLEAILNLAYLLDRDPSLGDVARGYARLLVEEIMRVSQITHQTLSFYRDTSDPAEVDMASILDAVLNLHRPLIQQRSILVSTKFQNCATVWGRSGELRQVFTNLLVNAIDALPHGGRIRVSVTRSLYGNSVCVTIADNGSGIPPNLRGKIFQPFFTTKISKGTGLGLWISQGILRKYGGSIRMRTSTAPRSTTGTVFRVCLPLRQLSSHEVAKPNG
ncbi:MAG: PAS domain S-box protein [Acidobacteriaceae bacterium]